MELKNQSSASGAAPVTSGDDEKSQKTESQNSDSAAPQVEDKVSYETHRKLLGEKKKLQDRLSELETKQKEHDEAILKEKQDWKTMLAIREKELAAERDRAKELESTLTNGIKLDAFMRAIGGEVRDSYLPLVDLQSIAIDPTTLRPDPMSVQEAANKFKEQFPEVVSRATGVKLPNGAAQTNSKITYDEWKKLPTKEMKARLRDVIGS